MNGSSPPFETAQALIECGDALDILGEREYGSVLRARGSTIAQYHGYFELIHQAEMGSKAKSPAAIALGPEAQRIATQVDALCPTDRPSRLILSFA
jgi:hypothetical protein